MHCWSLPHIHIKKKAQPHNGSYEYAKEGKWQWQDHLCVINSLMKSLLSLLQNIPHNNTIGLLTLCVTINFYCHAVTYIAASTLDSWNIYVLIQSKLSKNQSLRKTLYWNHLRIYQSSIDEGACLFITSRHGCHDQDAIPVHVGLPYWSDQMTPWARGKESGSKINVRYEFSFATLLIPEPWPSTAESTQLMQGKHLPHWLGLNVGPLFH